MSEAVEKLNKIEELAREVLILSRNTLLVNLRFLDMALSRLELAASENTSLRTDGRNIYYAPKHILRSYKAAKEIPVRDYLHVVMHCVFRHMFTDPALDHDRWDLACDIAVENIISELHLKAAAAAREEEQRPVLEALKKELSLITAEKVYAYLLEQDLSGESLEAMSTLFLADDHRLWHPPSKKNDENDETGDSTEASDEPDEDQEFSDDTESENPLAEEWKEIAEKLQTDLETFSKEQGDRAGSLIQNLSEVNRDRVDYEAFLRKFTSLGEVMKINDDEFDYIFYTFGLRLYRNMPLVEPLEYKEVRRIKDFVIAIDTSGSTSGELVRGFVGKTYSILKSTETFFSKINLHIIQCDEEIQEHVKITSQEEFDEYLEHMQIRGQGGTDFRPVFELVDRLIAEKEFSSLRGMIYFSDGFGTFPAKKPGYETAFVFLEDSYVSPQVPPWAIKLVLQKNEIQEIIK